MITQLRSIAIRDLDPKSKRKNKIRNRFSSMDMNSKMDSFEIEKDVKKEITYITDKLENQFIREKTSK
jgi:hypothetical protein